MAAYFKSYVSVANIVLYLCLVLALFFDLHWETAPYALAGVWIAITIASTDLSFGTFSVHQPSPSCLSSPLPPQPTYHQPRQTFWKSEPIGAAQVPQPTKHDQPCREDNTETSIHPGARKSANLERGPVQPTTWRTFPDGLRRNIKLDTHVHTRECMSDGFGVVEAPQYHEVQSLESSIRREAYRLASVRPIKPLEMYQLALTEDVYHKGKSETRKRRERRMRNLKTILHEPGATVRRLSETSSPSKTKLKALKRVDRRKEIHRREARTMKRLRYEGAEDWE